MNRKSWTAGVVIPFAAATMIAMAPDASAGGVAKVTSGRCTAASHWTMKAKSDNGRMELELEVDSNRNGQRWNVRIADNRVLVYKAVRVTVAPSGSFAVHALTADRRGTDRFVAVATNLSNGENCVARLNY